MTVSDLHSEGGGPAAQGPLAGRRVLLAVTGSIAAYKAVLLLRLLHKAGATVDVILTEAGARFVGPATFRGLGATVHGDMFSAPGELHVTLGQAADVLLIAPATADTLARLGQGRADDLLSATALCTEGMVVLAPAMHPRMWRDAAVEENVRRLTERGVRFIGPVSGEVASGDVGVGRLAEPEQIILRLCELLGRRQTLAGRHIVVTAGPTSEPLDPVRALTNVSSGKMGFAVARAAAERGATTTLVAGPVALPTPAGVTRIDVGSALDMQRALAEVLGPELLGADALVMSAAVADYRPRSAATTKMKRTGEGLVLELVPNPDLLAEIGAARRGTFPVLVGFALETATETELAELARHKRERKGVDLIVANRAADSLGRDDNRVLLVGADEVHSLPLLSKAEVAEHLLDWLGAALDRSGLPRRIA